MINEFKYTRTSPVIERCVGQVCAFQAAVPKKRLYICEDFADYTKGTERSAPARKIIVLGGGKGVLLGKPI